MKCITLAVGIRPPFLRGYHFCVYTNWGGPGAVAAAAAGVVAFIFATTGLGGPGDCNNFKY
jgi:hypothetical protein